MKNPTKAVKDARDQLHFSKTVSAKQAQRMAEGRVESRPEDWTHRVSPLDRERRQVRLALEDRKMAKELDLATGDVW